MNAPRSMGVNAGTASIDLVGVAGDLWPHQWEAIELACKALADGGRATQVLACGTGKTRIGAHAAAALAPRGQRLILAPTVTLLAQHLREYRATLGPDLVGRVLAVCRHHLTTAGQAGIEELEAQHVPVTTDPRLIAETVSGDGPVTVAATYQSLKALHRAHRDYAMPPWEVVVCDEAHRTVGGTVWSKAHDDEFLPARRRLNMTATPRLVTGRATDADLVGMDDESVFGPTIYRLGYATAIELGLLAQYRLVVSIVTDADIHVLTDESIGRTAMRLGSTVIAARMLAAQIAVLRAAAEYGVTRAISYHAGIDDARHFAATLPRVAQELPEGAGPRTVWAEHLRSEHPADIRHRRLSQLAEGAEGGLAVVSNARLLSEGVDVPAVDAVVFSDPRYSTVDIIQAIGRAVRLGGRPDKIATIIVPILAEPGIDVETALSGSAYAPVWQVMQALRSHDDELAAELDKLRRHGIGPGGRQRVARWLQVDGIDIDENFVNAITVRLIKSATAAWEEFYGAAIAYTEEYGDLLAPQDWVTDTGLGLGQWLNSQRTLYKRNKLRPERIRLLEDIGMVWSPKDALWEIGYAAAVRYQAKHGNLNPPQPYVDDDGYKLGSWLANQRTYYRSGTLQPERVRRLEALGITWNIRDAKRDSRWERALAAATRYRQHHGDLDVPGNYVTDDGFQLGQWIIHTRSRQAGLTPEQRAALTALDMIWQQRNELAWERGFRSAAQFYKQNGHLRVGQTYQDKDGFALGTWIQNQRRRQDRLSAAQRERLSDLKMIWSPRQAAWEQALAIAAAYVREHGHLHPPVSYRTPDGFPLGQWMSNRRATRDALNTDKRAQLDALDPTWAAG